MDPATIIGVASGAIAFLDFAIELVKGSHEIYSSLNGSTQENAHVDLVISDLESASASLLLQPKPSEAGLVSQHEKALRELGTKCHQKCIELLQITKTLQVHDRSKWSSFRTAWKSRWKKDDIDRMHNDLRDYRLAILLRLNQMQIENQLQAHEKLDAMLRDFRRPIQDKYPIEAEICSRIKNQLHFQSIHRREDGISDPGDSTFAWMLDESDDSDEDDWEVPDVYLTHERQARSQARSAYLSWLGQDVQESQSGTEDTGAVSPSSEVFHISGKAGSGKSTLMRYLFRHQQTRAALDKWAGTRTLVLASFYFWVASGDDMQKSLKGLYRTILHEVLCQHPELGPYLFPSQWQQIQRSIDRKEAARDSADAVLFRGKAIQEAFAKLVGSTASDSPIYCFCFFIDGLDEYRERAPNGVGDSRDLLPGFRNLAKQLIRWNKAAHVKFCTTARPHTEFLDPLRRDQATVLHLERVNQCDIYRYCKNAFEQDDDIAEMQTAYHHLLPKITHRAQGVFLWAILTVRALITSLTRGDSEMVQMQKLDAIPPELDSLYQLLLDRIDESDRDRSNRIFWLLLDSPGQLTRWVHVEYIYWLDYLTDINFPSSVVFEPEDGGLQRHRDQGRRLLSSLTHGMLVVDDHDTVEFCHRTAYDYMKERQACGQLTSKTLDFEKVDVYGRLCLADYANNRRTLESIMFIMKRVGHQNSADTYLRLAELLIPKIKAAITASKQTAAIPAPPIMAVIGLDKNAISETPMAVDDETVPIIESSVLGYAEYTLMQFWHQQLPRFDYGLPMISTENDRFIRLLFILINGSLPEGHSTLLDRVSDDCYCSAESLDSQSVGLPCPNWMFVAAAISNRILRCLLLGYSIRLEDIQSMTKVMHAAMMECKVALNDPRDTILTLDSLVKLDIEMPLQPNLKEFVDLCHASRWAENQVTEDGPDERLHNEADDKLDVTAKNGVDRAKLDQGIFIKYVEYEGYRLDSGFRIHVKYPDLCE